MEQDNSFIGDIKYSVIDPVTFTEQHPGWILLAGQEIAKSTKLGGIGITKLPDARGVFLRGVHLNRDDGKGDADGGKRESLSYQTDDFKSHNHGGGNHVHHWIGSVTLDTWGANAGIGGNNCGPKDTPSSGTIINTEGGIETRPQNISVYIYIKIN